MRFLIYNRVYDDVTGFENKMMIFLQIQKFIHDALKPLKYNDCKYLQLLLPRKTVCNFVRKLQKNVCTILKTIGILQMAKP